MMEMTKAVSKVRALWEEVRDPRAVKRQPKILLAYLFLASVCPVAVWQCTGHSLSIEPLPEPKSFA